MLVAFIMPNSKISAKVSDLELGMVQLRAQISNMLETVIAPYSIFCFPPIPAWWLHSICDTCHTYTHFVPPNAGSVQHAADDPSLRGLLSDASEELREELAAKTAHLECSLGALRAALARTESAVDRVESRLGLTMDEEARCTACSYCVCTCTLWLLFARVAYMTPLSAFGAMMLFLVCSMRLPCKLNSLRSVPTSRFPFRLGSFRLSWKRADVLVLRLLCAFRLNVQVIRTDVDQALPMSARVGKMEIELERIMHALALEHQKVSPPPAQCN